MKLKLTLSLFIIAISILAYLGYPIIKSRYFSVEKKSIIPGSEIKMEAERIRETENASFDSESLKITVAPSDCDNECSKFKKEDELKYCQEICGLSTLETETYEPNNCESKTGIQKDYCLKDLGTSKMDFKACEQIQDSGMKKACKNRVLEDIIENQANSEN